MVFLRFFISNVIPKTNTKVRHGCWWGVAVEISTKNAKMKNLFENNHLYECVTFHEFGRNFFTWSWISIYLDKVSLEISFVKNIQPFRISYQATLYFQLADSRFVVRKLSAGENLDKIFARGNCSSRKEEKTWVFCSK